MIGGGFALKTCNCEDFPCCGHNDVDPNWQPDPHDQYDPRYDFDRGYDEDDGEGSCSWCGEDTVFDRSDDECDECFSYNRTISLQKSAAKMQKYLQDVMADPKAHPFCPPRRWPGMQRAIALNYSEARDEYEIARTEKQMPFKNWLCPCGDEDCSRYFCVNEA